MRNARIWYRIFKLGLYNNKDENVHKFALSAKRGELLKREREKKRKRERERKREKKRETERKIDRERKR